MKLEQANNSLPNNEPSGPNGRVLVVLFVLVTLFIGGIVYGKMY